ncbi:Cysteine-rich DPF motif domain-containing protein 1 [Acropora cervicornis]|uniref:Cysteine-rich DPF motif domain-containing protein 1 n=1 Tax=Acropora cervicornis TaxID=6130 RepID=A0AAD9PR30_ACRCE|nr:Cysteine-rich DPF motif domain-containing protein 1 [Acropora cervicornis]
MCCLLRTVVGIFAKDLGLHITEGRPWVQGWSKMAAELTEKSLSDKPIFSCSSCAFECHYEYFGKKPPCSKSVMLLEDAYVIRDPFSPSAGHLTIGGNCCLCSKNVCMAQTCSIFYTKRFCISCVEKNIGEFPFEIQREITQHNLSSN